MGPLLAVTNDCRPASQILKLSIQKAASGQYPQTLQCGSLHKTDCRHRAIQNARSIPDIHISSPTVGNVESISMISAHAPDQ
jgi:hypothetical protein